MTFPASHSPSGYYTPTSHQAYASWIVRVLAYLLVGFLAMTVMVVPIVAGAIMVLADNLFKDEFVLGPQEWAGIAVMAFGVFAGFVFIVWNRGIRTGVRGQSLGKSLFGIEVISQSTGEYIGVGNGIVRMILDSILGNACFVNYLWPLWDENQQTWHDLIVKTIVVQKR